MQLEVVKVRTLAGVVHQLTQDEVALEALERVRFAGPEFDRVGPVTPAVGVVEHPHAGPVPVAHLGHAFRDRDAVGEFADHVRLPHGIDLILARVLRIVRQGIGRGDLGQAPFHAGELPGFVGERRAVETQVVHRETLAANVADLRLCGMLRVAGGGLEDEIMPGADVVFHQLHHPGKVLGAGALVKTTLAGLAGVDLAGGHDRVIVPLGAVGIDDRQPVGIGVVDDRRVFVDQLVAFVVVVKQVDDLAGAVAVFDLENRAAQQSAFERLLAVAVHVAGPGQVEVPRQGGPLFCLGVEVVEIVFAVADVVVVDALDDGAVAVVAGQVHVGAPPVLAGVALVAVHVAVEVGLVGDGERSLVVEVARSAFHLVQVAVRQVVLVEEPAVHLLDREVEPPKVAVVLRGPVFIGFVDNPKVHPVRVRRLDTGEIEQLEADRLEHPVLAPVQVVALLDAG